MSRLAAEVVRREKLFIKKKNGRDVFLSSTRCTATSAVWNPWRRLCGAAGSGLEESDLSPNRALPFASGFSARSFCFPTALKAVAHRLRPLPERKSDQRARPVSCERVAVRVARLPSPPPLLVLSSVCVFAELFTSAS